MMRNIVLFFAVMLVISFPVVMNAQELKVSIPEHLEKMDPATLLKTARSAREMFPPNLVGFNSDMTLNNNGKILKGRIKYDVEKGPEVFIDGIDNQIRDWLNGEVINLFVHLRRPNFDSKNPITISDDDSPVGRQVLLNDKYQSKYRIRYDQGIYQIYEVDRVIKDHFIISSLKNEISDNNKFLPSFIVAHFFDPLSGELKATESIIDKYKKIQDVWFPVRREVHRAQHGEVIPRIIELQNVVITFKDTTPSVQAPKIGLLILAHGGSPSSTLEVNNIASQLNEKVETEVAFGLASKPNIQFAIDKLYSRGVKEIIAVPLFVSSHSSVISSIQYLLGLKPNAPEDLGIFAAMSNSNANSENKGGQLDVGVHREHAGYKVYANVEDEQKANPMKPVISKAKIRWSPALDSHPIVEEILLSHATSISNDAANEVVIVVAHGPVTDDENNKWLVSMDILVEGMRERSNFKRIEYMTIRDDSPALIRDNATTELRAMVEKATGENHQVLIVPLLLSSSRIQEGIKNRLNGLTYTICNQGLLPDPRIVKWVGLAAGVQF